MISLKTHNIVDYILGAVLVLCPYAFSFSNVLLARNIFIILGAVLIAYSLFTKYQFAASRVIPLRVHMTLDVFIGAILLLAPMVFRYRDQITDSVYALHWIAGLGTIAFVAITRHKTRRDLKLARDPRNPGNSTMRDRAA